MIMPAKGAPFALGTDMSTTDSVIEVKEHELDAFAADEGRMTWVPA